MPRRLILLLTATLFSAPAFAMSNNLDEAAKDPTYEPKKVLCSGGSCQAIVMNKKGIGVVVKGKKKTKTKEKASKKADELNEEAKEGEISADDDNLFDVCLQYPDIC